MVIAALAGLILGAGLSLVRPLEYRSSIRLLITQQTASVDAYTASRSVERIADDLANIVPTKLFFDQVLNVQYDVNPDQFPSEITQPAKRRKVWQRMISTTVSRGTGLLSIDVYNRDKEQARQISNAVGFILTQQGWRYTSGSDISVRLVDSPLVSRYPVRPNIPANGFIGLVLGALVGGAIVIVRAEQIRRRLRHGS